MTIFNTLLRWWYYLCALGFERSHSHGDVEIVIKEHLVKTFICSKVMKVSKKCYFVLQSIQKFGRLNISVEQ